MPSDPDKKKIVQLDPPPIDSTPFQTSLPGEVFLYDFLRCNDLDSAQVIHRNLPNRHKLCGSNAGAYDVALSRRYVVLSQNSDSIVIDVQLFKYFHAAGGNGVEPAGGWVLKCHNSDCSDRRASAPWKEIGCESRDRSLYV